MQYVLECTEADLDRSLSEPEKMADIVIPMLIAALFKKKVFEASLRSTESRRNRKTIRHAWRTTHSGPRSTLPRIGDQAIPQRVAPQHCPPPLTWLNHFNVAGSPQATSATRSHSSKKLTLCTQQISAIVLSQSDHPGRQRNDTRCSKWSTSAISSSTLATIVICFLPLCLCASVPL